MSQSAVKSWVEAMRLRTLPVSMAGVIAAVAYAVMDHVFQWLPALLCLLFAVLAQIASNFANEYYDFKAGLDRPGREGPRRGVTEGDISPAAMLRATLGVLACACAIGLCTVYWDGWWLVLAGVVIALGVLAYSAGPYPLSRHGWGETAVVFFFGIIPVTLTYYVMAHTVTWHVLMGGVAIGLMGANVLIVNNYRDKADDEAVGKRTMAVIFGRKAMGAVYYANGWVAVGLMWWVWLRLGSACWAYCLIPVAYLIIHTKIYNNMKKLRGKRLNKYLGITAIAMLGYSVLFLIAAATMPLISCSSKHEAATQVEWKLLSNNQAENNYSHQVTITGDTDFKMLAYNSLPANTQAVNPQDTIVEIIPGYYAIASSRFGQGADTIVVELTTKGLFRNIAYAPDSFHKIMWDESTQPVEYSILPLEPTQWECESAHARVPSASDIYALNERLRPVADASVYDVIPSYKEVKLMPGESSAANLAYEYVQISDPRPEYYTITVRNDSLIVAANDEKTARNMAEAFIAKVASANAMLPNVVIEDYPDFPYRALMIDIARNYQTPETMRQILSDMRDYRMNVLHFHPVDDEAWRLEIKPLPELITVGSRRGYTRDDSEFLAQVYSGNGDPDADVPSANGYFTREDFITMLQYADSLGITVITEIESPGHARAAVRAMEKRYRDTGDDTYRLIHDGDDSDYTSAQAYHDNVMNPALPGTYKFMETVLGEICDMYAEAGAPLPAIHIGGDEVARGAWDGSSQAQKFIADNNLDGQTGLHGYFVRRIAKMLADRGVKVSGWQEIAMEHTSDYDADMAPQMYSVNCWHTSGRMKDAISDAIRKGYPIVLSVVDHFYMDQSYNANPMENGLTWGGLVDEIQSLHGYPFELCPVDASLNETLLGVSGQLFAETIRSPHQLQVYLYPKMMGLAERAWNASPTYGDQEYLAVIEQHEIPRWEKQGRGFHVRQPGINVEDGTLHINSAYRGGEIRYTTDGSTPTADSPLYTGPVAVGDAKDIRAVQFLNGEKSLVTYWY